MKTPPRTLKKRKATTKTTGAPSPGFPLRLYPRVSSAATSYPVSKRGIISRRHESQHSGMP